MKRLQERYANDREKLSKEMMALYQERESVGQLFAHVAADASIFGSLLGITRIRRTASAPFIFWIDDLAAMDPYFILRC